MKSLSSLLRLIKGTASHSRKKDACHIWPSAWLFILFLSFLPFPAHSDLSFYDQEYVPPEERSYPNKGAMKFEFQSNGGKCQTCNWISAEGKITEQTPDDFLKFIGSGSSGLSSIIAINSRGGDLFGAMRLGRLFRSVGVTITINHTSIDSGIPDYAPGVCISACALAFLGGKVRLANGGELGVHQFFSTDGSSSELNTKLSENIRRQMDLFTTSEISKYLEEMGVKRFFYEKLSGTAPGSMHYFSEDELLNFLITTDPDQARFEWLILPYENGLVAQAEVPRSSMFPDGGIMRFYCSQNQVLMTYIFEHPVESDFYKSSPLLVHEGILDSINREQPFFQVDSVEINHQLALQAFNPDNMKSVFVFSIDHRSLASLISGKEFSSGYNWTVSRASSGWLQAFHIGALPDDNRPLEIALRNCIN